MKVLKDHLRYCQKQVYLQCEYCPFITKYNANLKIHISSMHSMSKFTEEVCSNCARVFKNERCLKMHLRICESPSRFQCYDCSKKFKSKSNLSNHISRMHLKVSVNGEIIGDNLYLQCNECTYRTKHKDDLKKHVIKHYGNINADCEKCGRTYKNQGYLKKHLQCCQKQDLECYHCPFKTHSKGIMKKHVYGMHIKGPRYECPDCGKTYKKESYVVQHIEHHCGKEPRLMCEYCPFRTNYSHNLRKHRTSRHLKNTEALEVILVKKL
ncbi:zinc finger protein 711-like isoform X2 [Phymastichus coffea]|nr:zinc finger protein 711-like isoform X2 [Phymastichus coffea]